MKLKTYNEELKDIAHKAMQSMLVGLYSDPNSLFGMNQASKLNNVSLPQEIAEQSFLLAQTMMTVGERYMKGEPIK